MSYAKVGNFSNVLTKVIGPHGLTNTLQHDSSSRLTNIVDTIGLNSQMQYSATDLTALVTPYGTNTFAYFSNSTTMFAVKVTELGIRNHFYLHYAQVEGGKIPSNHTGVLPNTTNGSYFAIANKLDHLETDKRNSFYWGPRQYENLSDVIRTNLSNGNFNVSNITSADYLKAKMNHWLKRPGSTNLGNTLSFTREPSAGDSVQGQVRWFDYVGKAAADEEGTLLESQLVALKLPSGEGRFIYSERNILGHRTLTAETYTALDNTCRLRTNRFEYAANNIDLTRHVQIIESTSKQVSSNVFNSAHRILTNFNALNEATAFSYNTKQQETSVKTPGGLTTTNIYESSGAWSNFLAQRVQLEIKNTNSFTYSNGYVFTHTDAAGLTNTHTHDALGRRLKTIYPDSTALNNGYSNLDLIQRIDRLGNTNRYAYNGFRQLVQDIDARGHTNTYVYCDCGSLNASSDRLGNITSFAYDQAGRRYAAYYPSGQSITNNHDLLGWVTNVADSAGNSVTNWFNNQGMVCIVSNGFGCQQMTKYDLEDRVFQSIDANNVTTSFAYDDLGRRTFVTNGLGTIATLKYSSLGLIAQTNQMTNWIWYAYDTAGRKTAETNANGEVTQFKYDASGNLTNLIDPKGNNTFWKFDQYGRVTNKTDTAGSVIFTYAYDANGRLTNRWTPAKGNTRYSYDATGNLTNVDYASSADISMQYDANNRLISMLDGIGTTTYAYTDFGALLSEDGPWADDTVSYSYTSNRLRNQLTLLQPNASAWVQNYFYDTTKRLTNIASSAGTFSYLYDTDHPMLVRRLTVPGNSYITNTYDGLDRLTATTLKNSSATTLNAHTYAYDDASRRTRQTRTGGDYLDYGYDKVGQLTSALGLELGGTTNRWHERFFYTYDPAGNLSNRVQNVQTNVFKVDNLNQLTSVVRTNTSGTVAGTTMGTATNVTVAANGGAASAADRFADTTFARTNVTLLNGTNMFTAVAQDSLGRTDTNTVTTYLPTAVTFLFDQNGNMRTNGTRIFEYDDENQLTRITEPNAWKSEFAYDGKMRRRIRKEYTWQNSTWVLSSEMRYVYDDKLVIQERDPLNVPRATYCRGTDLSGSLQGAGGIGGLLARVDYSLAASGDLRANAYYHADGNGNVTCLLDTNQLVIARYLYDPFGNTIYATGPAANANLYRFSSKELHEPSGLVYYLYRYYDPNLQRWPNSDPIVDTGFKVTANHRSSTFSDELALYKFVNNNPLNDNDSFGLLVPANLLNYGNWCGPGKSGPGAPIDNIDAACQKHDNCLLPGFLNPIRQCVCWIQFCSDAADASCLSSPNPVECSLVRFEILNLCPSWVRLRVLF